MIISGIIGNQMRVSAISFYVILGITAVIWSAVFILGAQYGVSIRDLTRDPAAITGYPAYVGFVSQLGIMAWSAAFAICALGYTVLTSRAQRAVRGQNRILRLFLFCSALLTLLLGVDDAFMLHERVYPHLNIPDIAVSGIYAGAALVYLIAFARIIIGTEFLLLFAALGFFALSVGTDFIFPPKDSPFWIEDGAKMTGILCWLGYYLRSVTGFLSAEMAVSNQARPVTQPASVLGENV